MATISITCPNCAKILRCKAAPPEGKKVKCPSCNDVFVPELDEQEDEATGIQENANVKANSASNGTDEEGEEESPRKKRRRDYDDDDDDEDDRPQIRKKAKKKNKNKSGNSAMLVILLVVGGVFLLLACVAGGIGWVVWSAAKQVQMVQKDFQKNFPLGNIDFPPPKDLPKGQQPKTQSFNLGNLQAETFQERQFVFQKNKRVIITSLSKANGFADIDLYVFRGVAGINVVAADASIGPNSRVDFIVPETDTYRVRIINVGGPNATSTAVTIDEY